MTIQGTITYDSNTDCLNCTCGNITATDGFVAVDNNGIECEPDLRWLGAYMCQNCGAIWHQDPQGWVLKWYKHPEKLMYWPNPENRDVQIEGFRWSDYTHAYDIYAPTLQGPFVVEACTGDDIAEGLTTLEEAKTLCQREYAHIMIALHGSRAEYLKEKRKKKAGTQ